MRVVRVIADLQVDDLEAARVFCGGFLGLTEQAFNLGWVARHTSPETGAMVQVLTQDVAAPEQAADALGEPRHLPQRLAHEGWFLAGSPVASCARP